MSANWLSLIPSILVGFLITAVNLISAIALLKQRHMGPRLMFAGACVSISGMIAMIGFQIFLISGITKTNGFMAYQNWWLPISSLNYLGSLLFAIGLLLHALHLRGRADRIAELEAILNSRNNP
jgi:hypothetical protein